MLKIDTKKINQQQNEIKQTYISTKTKQDINLTPTKLTATPSMTPISDRQSINIGKLRNEPFGHTLINKTTYSVRIIFQNGNGPELSSTSHTLGKTYNAINNLLLI